MNTRLTTPENQDKSIALELKPFPHIETLINHVLPAAERVVIGRGEVVHYYKDDIRQCFYYCKVASRCTVAAMALF